MAIYFDAAKTQLKDDVIFVVDSFAGKSKTNDRDFYKITFLSLVRDGSRAYCSDKFVDKSIYDSILGYGYYRVKTCGLRGDWESITPIKQVTI